MPRETPLGHNNIYFLPSTGMHMHTLCKYKEYEAWSSDYIPIQPSLFLHLLMEWKEDSKNLKFSVPVRYTQTQEP